MDVGIDIIKIDRIKKINSLEKIFTKTEIDYCNTYIDKNIHFAGIFSAKEAIKKAYNVNLSFKNIEICHDNNKKPFVKINNQIIDFLKISISHDTDYATAICLNHS